MDRACCFSGHRDVGFDMGSYAGHVFRGLLAQAVNEAVAAGYRLFYTGLAVGFDIIAAELVIQQRGAGLQIVSVVPFKGQERKYSAAWRRRYDSVLRSSADVIELNAKYLPGCYQERNRFLVDNSQRLICLFNGKKGGTKHTCDYAAKKGLEIVNIWDNNLLITPK